MSNHDITSGDREAWGRLQEFGLRRRPLHDPLGDSHHADMPITDEDKALANDLAWFMGTLGWEESSVDQWCRVVRALRYHGLKLSNAVEVEHPCDDESEICVNIALQGED